MRRAISTVIRLFAALALMLCQLSSAAERERIPAPTGQEYFKTPEFLVTRHIGQSEWEELEALITGLATAGQRAEDGRHVLYLVTMSMERYLGGGWNEDQDEQFQVKWEQYRDAVPNSVVAPLVEVFYLRGMAWRARGSDYASKVTPEGWALFKARNAKAMQVLQQSREGSSLIPTWYEQAIEIGIDSGMTGGQLTALFNEAIRRHPGYHGIYFAYLRRYSPRWGGSDPEARRFIEAQVAAPSNVEGEILYTRLYWSYDGLEGRKEDFFKTSFVSWERMRRGFDLLMAEYPASRHNQAAFAAYACRAGDAGTYLKWVKGLTAGEFNAASRRGLTKEICTARMTTQA